MTGAAGSAGLGGGIGPTIFLATSILAGSLTSILAAGAAASKSERMPASTGSFLSLDQRIQMQGRIKFGGIDILNLERRADCAGHCRRVSDPCLTAGRLDARFAGHSGAALPRRADAGALLESPLKK